MPVTSQLLSSFRYYSGFYETFNYTGRDELVFDDFADVDVEYDTGFGGALVGGIDFGAFRLGLEQLSAYEFDDWTPQTKMAT